MAAVDIAAILAGGPEFKWLKLLSGGYLTSKEKRFGVSALSAEFEGTEILKPMASWDYWLGLKPTSQAI
jgi:hypothetical protein